MTIYPKSNEVNQRDRLIRRDFTNVHLTWNTAPLALGIGVNQLSFKLWLMHDLEPAAHRWIPCHQLSLEERRVIQSFIC